jgi:hypothetical protein
LLRRGGGQEQTGGKKGRGEFPAHGYTP